MRRFVNETLFWVVEWGVVVVALSIASAMALTSCTEDRPARAGFVLF